MLDLEYCELTDEGNVRDHNEDYFGHYVPASPDESRTHGWLFVVADGVGGHDRAAGVQASPLGKILADRTGVTLDKAGRVTVQPDLSIPGHPEILVAGDLAQITQDGAQVPGVAPAAMQQGRYAAKLIAAKSRNQSVAPFHYHDKGSLATIGRNRAVAMIGKLHFHGYPAWLLWLFIHLLYIVEFESRILIAIQWGFAYFTFNRGARLITGITPSGPPKAAD